MKFFSKKEIKIVGIILFLIAFVSFFNFRVSIRRARDNQRKNDLGTLQSALENYNHATGMFPLSSSDGKILACKGSDTYFDEEKQTWVNIKVCDWGKDDLADFSDPDNPVFMSPIPIDPKNLDGISFIYLSNGKRYQLLAHLEGKDEAEYNPKVEARAIMCGDEVCNYAKAFSSTPIDISVEEYENQLLEEKDK